MSELESTKPDRADRTRKRTPGIGEHIRLIAQYNEEINKVKVSIDECKDKISAEIARERENSKRSQLLHERSILEAELRGLQLEKSALIEKRSGISASFRAEKEQLYAEKKRLNVQSLEEISRRERALEKHLIARQMSSRMEKKIAAETNDLARKRISFEALKDKDIYVKNMEKELNDINKELDQKTVLIDKSRKKLTLIRQEIEKLNEKEKEKSDVIRNLEKTIESLKKKKQEYIDKKKAEHKEIENKEKAYQAFLEEQAKQLEIEKQRKEQISKIKDLEQERNKLLMDIGEIDPSKFDGLIHAVKGCKSESEGTLSIPITVVSALAKMKIKIPQTNEEVDACISELESKKEKYKSEIGNKIIEIENKVKEFDNKIEQEKKYLESMPVADIILPKSIFENK
ncbi:hypothetical protein TCON_0066 [Astathelohania contejeani]|uniref:Uncharacterized protein n=1 Tax=Astathelohania contejeani TaxID=164912 RepID=A0ABQ7I2S8_9MICR|nr:hypothetical protein TCON_0066 [Thelohania contejeani]